MTEMPELPPTIEQCHIHLRTLWNGIHLTRLYIGNERWAEGYWVYRDHENGKLFLVAGQFVESTPIVAVNWDRILFMGTLGEIDPIERDHAQGQEILTMIDNMDDFESMAEYYHRSK